MSHWIDRVRALTGVEDEPSVQRIVRATLSVLLEQLSASDRAWLSQAIASNAGELPAGSAPRTAEGLQDFYERVAAREGVAIGFATEHAQSVCRALTEQLGSDSDAIQRLKSRLPDALAVLFQPVDPVTPPVHDHARVQHTLAAGKAGSRTPLSEAAAQRAQRESVARSENPHADTKLSSNRGTTQQREAETIAEYHPDARPPRR